ncbi:hypothetical protein GF318_03705 [Candidatus Micrarchaeota archaeon]|nr:hypothetical protein [Candidatus Micrarchaeota archaeon]
MSFVTILAEWFSRLHFLAALAMFFFIALMVLEEDRFIRALMLLPVVLFYTLSKVMYSIDQKASTDRIVEKYKKG